MTISANTATALASAYQNQYVRGLGISLKSRFPSRTHRLQPHELDDFVGGALSKCPQYGIDQELDVRRFVELCVLYGPGFDRDLPWAARILAQEGVSGHERMRQLDEYELFVLGGGPR